MRTRASLGLVLVAAVAAAVWLPVQPVYATSDSMAPAIGAGDLYFVVEGATVGPGDVVTYEATGPRGLVTHRVVGETTAGFVTKGDANPSTDQAAGFPAVDRSRVVGRVLEVGGRPVVVRGAGGLYAALAVRPSLLTFGSLLLAALLLFSRRPATPVPDRQVVYAGDVLGPLFVGGLMVCLLFVLWGASTHDLVFVAAQGGATATHTVPVGEAATRTVAVETHHLPLTTVIVEAEGVAVVDRTPTPSGAELDVAVPALDRPGVYRASVAVATYPATLPRAVIERLHARHWLAAAMATVAPVYLPLSLLAIGLVDGRAPLRPPVVRWLRRVGWS